MASAYYPGNPIYMQARFKNAITNVAEDPDNVELYIKPHNGSRITVTVGDLDNPAVGHWTYIYNLAIDAVPGDIWCYGFRGWDGIGNPYASKEFTFVVLDPCVLPTE